MGNKALIYCRVSSERQVNDGNGLGSQEQTCRDYSKRKGYQVVGVFSDGGVSGKLVDRNGYNNLLLYIDKHPCEIDIVVMDTVDRFARDLQAFILLSLELKNRKVRWEYARLEVEDNKNGRLIEGIHAVLRQFFREDNRDRVVERQKARLEQGYWPFCYPKGLINKKDPVHGKLLVACEPYAGIYKMAIEGFADRTLGTLEDVRQFINSEYKKSQLDKECSLNGARLILSQILYTGYVEYKPWGVGRRKGQHEGFISLDTYENVQARFAGKEKFGFRKDFDPEFPLRQLVTCKYCGGALTGSRNKGRTKSYSNYACKTAGCPYRWKVIHKDEIEPKFESLLTAAKPWQETLDLVSEVLFDAWEQSKAVDGIAQAQNEAKVKELDGLIKNAKERMVQINDELIKAAYEDEYRQRITEKDRLVKIRTPMYSAAEFGTATDRVITALKNPLEMWKSEYLEDKRTIFYMYFGRKLPYDRDLGFGIVSLEPSIELIRSSEGDKSRLVEMEGVEPSCE